MYKCTNCVWEGEELSKQSEGAMWDDKCPNCGDEVKSIEDKISKAKPESGAKIDFDFNDDGVIDSKDRTVAAKFLGSKRGKPKKGVNK